MRLRMALVPMRADWLLCGISLCRRLARAASACSRTIVAAVSVEVMLGPGIALIWRGLGTRTDKPILIFWVCANGRSEPEAADNRTESRKVLSLYGSIAESVGRIGDLRGNSRVNRWE